MAAHDPTLQELIVRALTGQDRRAQRRLEAAAGRDPELKRFCEELDEVVSTLVGSRDWRKQAPSPELTSRIREAVVAKLPDAPPHFNMVLMDADLGRRRTLWRLLGGVLLVGIVAAGAVWALMREQTAARRLRLNGQVAYETPLQGEKLEGWEFLGAGAWSGDGQGLRHEPANDGGEAAGVYLKRGIAAEGALAFNLDVSAPELGAGSHAAVFLAEAEAGGAPAFGPNAKPARGLLLELSADGLVLYGPDAELLQSRPVNQGGAGFYRLRLEHLGPYVRVLVNGDVIFDGQPSRALHGKLHPGWRAAGPENSQIRFNAARIER
ncbi:MAG: hypothetical protein M5U26_24355 [Planctomycetota bacterium]|nr:hypothetical protein [Planctomycetota bacterium]